MRSLARPSSSNAPENTIFAPSSRAYLMLFWMSWPRINSSHFSSVKTSKSRFSHTGATCAAMSSRALALIAPVTKVLRFQRRIR